MSELDELAQQISLSSEQVMGAADDAAIGVRMTELHAHVEAFLDAAQGVPPIVLQAAIAARFRLEQALADQMEYARAFRRAQVNPAAGAEEERLRGIAVASVGSAVALCMAIGSVWQEKAGQSVGEEPRH